MLVQFKLGTPVYAAGRSGVRFSVGERDASLKRPYGLWGSSSLFNGRRVSFFLSFFLLFFEGGGEKSVQNVKLTTDLHLVELYFYFPYIPSNHGQGEIYHLPFYPKNLKLDPFCITIYLGNCA